MPLNVSLLLPVVVRLTYTLSSFLLSYHSNVGKAAPSLLPIVSFLFNLRSDFLQQPFLISQTLLIAVVIYVSIMFILFIVGLYEVWCVASMVTLHIYRSADGYTTRDGHRTRLPTS